jgi:integrase
MIDFRKIGKEMPRRRDERGWVKKVGRIQRMWEGYFNVYVRMADGTEKRRRRSRILGPCAEMTKNAAIDELRKIILRERSVVPVVDEPVASVVVPVNPTFADIWQRYRTLKESSWSNASRKAVVSVFEAAPPKEGKQNKPRRPSVLQMIGSRQVVELTPDPIQQMLNNMAAAGYSYSSVRKTRTYVAAALEYAVGERVIQVNPAARVELPGAKLRKPTKRAYGLEEMRRLLSAARSVSLREHLIVRIFYVCGLRPGELFALRVDDVEPELVRIDEALKETEKGTDRIGETKTESSNAYVSISEDLYKEITTWLTIRNMGDPYHRNRPLAPNDLLFPTEAGTPYRIGNYLKRILKPIAAKAGIPDMTYRPLRRTFATQFQRHGSPKDAQAQLRHSKLEMTGWYMRDIPESVRAAVEEMDAEICKAVDSKSNPVDPGRLQ